MRLIESTRLQWLYILSHRRLIFRFDNYFPVSHAMFSFQELNRYLFMISMLSLLIV